MADSRGHADANEPAWRQRAVSRSLNAARSRPSSGSSASSTPRSS